MSDLLDSWRSVADRDLPASLTVEPEARVLRLQGEIDTHNAGLMPSLVLDIGLDSTAVVVDLAAVTFIDTAAVRAFLLCETRLAHEGVDFWMRNPQPDVAQVLELTNTAYLLHADRAVAGIEA
jgi:anti-anti-sigma factor